MTLDKWLAKFTSRKFILAVAAFLGALGSGLSGAVSPDTCIIVMAVSAGLYAFAEAWTDGKALEASTTETHISQATNLNASTYDKEVFTVMKAETGASEKA